MRHRCSTDLRTMLGETPSPEPSQESLSSCRLYSAEAEAPLFATRSGACFTEAGFDKIFQRLAERSAVRGFSAHVLRHTWATNFMRAPHASLLELKRQGGWERWDMVERYSHATPPRDRSALPNPLQKNALHKSAVSQPPSS